MPARSAKPGERPDDAQVDSPRAGPLRAVLVAGALLALVALIAIGLRCLYDPALAFLPRASGASWIVYPVPPQTRAHPKAEFSCEFRRVFDLADVPASATLELRAFRRASVVLNGTALAGAAGDSGSWKKSRSLDVAKVLRAGRNELSVMVSNDKGPSALWLRLAASNFALGTDASWEASLAGASWERARDVATFRGAPIVETRRSTFQALRQVALTLALFGALAALLVVGARYVPWKPRPAAVIGVVAAAWVVLFWNDFRSLPMSCGFDVAGHLAYIDYVRERKALPLANEGWEMYQPPLYYVVSAAALELAGASPGDDAGKGALRAVTLGAAIAQIAFILASLRLLFPLRPRAQLAGALFAAFVPVHLYVFQYVTNETLAATLASATVYLALRALLEERPSLRLLALLGGTMGAAMLTKLSAVLLLPTVVVATIANLLSRSRSDAKAWLSALGVPLAVCLVVCGWYYVRVWQHFGSPFVGNWDEGLAVAWWQDPGYRTASYYVQFGRSLTEPFFAGFHGFPDGLYSTFWGDGLWGGVPNATARPPWNYELMEAGYLVALLPSALIAVGIAAGLVALWRRPRVGGLVLAGLGAGTGIALIAMTLKIPSYAQVKAFYVLPSVIPLCAALGYGFDLVERRSKIGGALLAVGLGVWALGAYASFWIRADAPDTLTARAIEKVLAKETSDALPLLRRAVALDPENTRARVWLGYALSDAGEALASREQILKALELDPSQADAAVAIASALDAEGKPGEAMALLRRTIAASPDSPDAPEELGLILHKTGAIAEAIEALRRAIGRKPDAPEIHHALGLAYAASGRNDEAIDQFRVALEIPPHSVESRVALAGALSAGGRYAEALAVCRGGLADAPNEPNLLAESAWILATCPDDTVRNGVEALGLAEKAARTRGPHSLRALDALGAAYAELGRFDDAVRTVRALADALRRAGRLQDAAAVDSHRLAYESGSPWRDRVASPRAGSSSPRR